MSWRRILLSGGAAIGAAMAYNRLASRGVAPLRNLLGGTEGWFEWRGHQVSYSVRGSGSPVLLVHSIHAAATSCEWRSNVDELARHYRVYAMDLLGFGRSDRPAIRYSAGLYRSLIADFARRVIAAPTALVASSLSGAYAIALAASDPERFPAICVVCPSGISSLDSERGGSEASRAVLDAPLIGTATFNALVSRASLTSYLKRVYYADRFVTPELVDVYYATSHQPGARHAPAAFVARQLDLDIRADLRRLTVPMLVVWGEQAEMTPVEDARAFRALNPGCELVVLSPAGDLPHDELADEFNEVLLGFLASSYRPAEAAGIR